MVVPWPGLEMMSMAPCEEAGAFAHAHEAVSVGAGGWVEADTVVTDADAHRLFMLDDFHRGAFRATVFTGVGECLLNNPVDRGFELVGVSLRVSALLVCEIDVDVDVQAGTRGAVGQ
jgi:hypothetical protein